MIRQAAVEHNADTRDGDGIAQPMRARQKGESPDPWWPAGLEHAGREHRSRTLRLNGRWHAARRIWHAAGAVTPKQIDTFCSTLPAATRTVQWEGVVVFKVGGKMFCLIAPTGHSVGRISFKCAPEHYDALSRSEGFRPAPYLARAKWVALDDPRVLTPAQTKAYLRRAHAVIAAALPKQRQAELGL